MILIPKQEPRGPRDFSGHGWCADGSTVAPEGLPIAFRYLVYLVLDYLGKQTKNIWF